MRNDKRTCDICKKDFLCLNSHRAMKHGLCRSKLTAFNGFLTGWIEIEDGRPYIELPFYPNEINKLFLMDIESTPDRPSVSRAKFERYTREGRHWVYKLTEIK